MFGSFRGVRPHLNNSVVPRGDGPTAARWARCLVAMLLVMLLCSCTWMHTRLLSPISTTRIHVDLPASASLSVVGGQHYSGAEQNQDYILMRGPTAQAELIYISAFGPIGRAAVRYHGDRLRQFTGGWSVNADGIRNWGAAQTLKTPLADFHYVRYSTGRPTRACAAYQALWDVPPGDVYNRPAKIIFGYYCAQPDTPFDAAAFKQFLGNLQVGFYSESGQRQAPIPLLPAQTEKKQTGYHPFPRLLPIFRAPAFNANG